MWALMLSPPTLYLVPGGPHFPTQWDCLSAQWVWMTLHHPFCLEIFHHPPPLWNSVVSVNVTRHHLKRFSFTLREANWTIFPQNFPKSFLSLVSSLHSLPSLLPTLRQSYTSYWLGKELYCQLMNMLHLSVSQGCFQAFCHLVRLSPLDRWRIRGSLRWRGLLWVLQPVNGWARTQVQTSWFQFCAF